MTQPRPLPCGAWPSPLSPEALARGIVSLGYAGAAAGALLWVEDRPAEQGRSVLVRRHADGTQDEVFGPDISVRSRVHEYGGLPWGVTGGRTVACDFASQALHEAGVAGPLTPPGLRYADFAGLPDGHRLLAVREDHRAAGEPVNAVVLLDLDAPGDGGRVLFDGSDFVAWPRAAADGRVACVAWDHPAMPWDETRLMVGRLDGGAWQCVAGGPGESVLEPQWGADGRLYFVSDRSGWWNLQAWDGTEVRALTSLRAEVGGPLWNLGRSSYALTGDGRALLRVTRGTRDTLELLDLRSGALTPLPLPYANFGAFGLQGDGRAYALAVPEDAMPALVRFALDGSALEVVVGAGASPLPAAAVSRGEAVEFPTAPGPDGTPRTAHAWFYPPQLPGVAPAAGETPPLMVMLHGGPTSHVGPSLKLAVQFWTTRGFAVVDVNYGGSTGYGRAYRERLRGQWGVVDLQDAVAAVDFLAESGRVDGARVAIRGGSAGGFTVLSALAFTRRFAAGINYYGVADLQTLAADTHKFESRYLDSLVAPLPAGRDLYRARSPVHHMARCRAALLTLQGSDDRAVPPQQSRDIVAAARAAGCPVAYLEFEGEGHGFRKAANIVRGLQAEVAFLGRVFGYTPADAVPPLALDNEAGLPPSRC